MPSASFCDQSGLVPNSSRLVDSDKLVDDQSDLAVESFKLRPSFKEKLAISYLALVRISGRFVCLQGNHKFYWWPSG